MFVPNNSYIFILILYNNSVVSGAAAPPNLPVFFLRMFAATEAQGVFGIPHGQQQFQIIFVGSTQRRDQTRLVMQSCYLVLGRPLARTQQKTD